MTITTPSQFILTFVLTSCIVFVIPSFAELLRLQQPAKRDGSLSYLVVGDWGRKGQFNQSRVALQMGRTGKKLDIDFVISTGDNFYEDGLKGVDDPAFEESFTNVYTAKSLQKQWYSVLGNHDYRGDTEAQLSQILRNKDTRWLCQRNFVLNAETAEFFFVDTTPFVDNYYNDTDHTYNWRGTPPRGIYLNNILKDLDSALMASTTRWKIVVGHHAIRSAGHHGDTPELIEYLLPILKTHNVDFYMNGHDHCLEHISSRDSTIQFLTSGAGSKAWRGDIKEHENLRFFYDGQGFMSLQMTQTHAQILFYDVFGQVLYKWDVSKPLHSSV